MTNDRNSIILSFSMDNKVSTWPIQPPRKHLDWEFWRQTLEQMINNISNRKVQYPLERWYRNSLIHWKWLTQQRQIGYMYDTFRCMRII